MKIHLPELKQQIAAFQDKEVLIVGDIMLDKYILGQVDRISPEAPVPVVNVSGERIHLGGAGNVAKNIKSLGGAPKIIGLCGDDKEADELYDLLKTESLEQCLVRTETRPTTVKTRVIAHNQQVVRFDKEIVETLGETIAEELLKKCVGTLHDGQVVIISDYGKGVVNTTLMQGIHAFVREKKWDVKILVDPKPMNAALYENVFLLTPNTKEAGEMTGLFALTEKNDIKKAGRRLKEQLGVKNALVTLGAKGMALVGEDEKILHIPTTAQDVYDVTGAGDTVIATAALSLAAGTPLWMACVMANYAAGLVVAELGTASVNQAQMMMAVDKLPIPEITEWNNHYE